MPALSTVGITRLVYIPTVFVAGCVVFSRKRQEAEAGKKKRERLDAIIGVNYEWLSVVYTSKFCMPAFHQGDLSRKYLPFFLVHTSKQNLSRWKLSRVGDANDCCAFSPKYFGKLSKSIISSRNYSPPQKRLLSCEKQLAQSVSGSEVSQSIIVASARVIGRMHSSVSNFLLCK